MNQCAYGGEIKVSQEDMEQSSDHFIPELRQCCSLLAMEKVTDRKVSPENKQCKLLL